MGTRSVYTRAELDALTKGRANTPRSIPMRPLLPERMEAACGSSGFHPDTWFSEEPEDIELARSVCAECPVRRECLTHALTVGEDEGMWGGLTDEERKQESLVREALLG